MVSLRERKSRPSYASMAEGLANLSDEDELESKSPHASGSRSKSGSKSGSGFGSSSNSSSSSGSGDESSVSSGDSSAFDPSAGNGDKRGRHKGKGKAKVRPGSKVPSPNDNVSSFEDEDEDSEDDLMDEDDDDDETMPAEEEEEGDDIIPVNPSPRQKQTTSSNIARSRPVRIRQTIDANTFSPSDTKLLPRAYQDLLKSAARELSQEAKPIKDATALRAHHDRMRVVGIEGFSTGPLTPFTTRLRSNPADHWASGQRSGQETFWIPDEVEGEARQAKRRMRIWEWEIAVAVETPWQVWEGEGWWSEMTAGAKAGGHANRNREKGKGKQRPEGWLLRQEVRIGLNDVGRLNMETLDLLTEADAELYLPTLIDQHGNPWVSLRYGLESEELIAMAMFESRSLGDMGSFDEGCLVCAGGPIWGMDWCPQGLNRTSKEFLAISALPHIDTQPAIGERWPADSQGCLQIWSLTPPLDATGATMRCEMVLCVEGGNAMDIKWMPIGAWDEIDEMVDPNRLSKLGILAAAQLDGSIGLYSVPHPDALRQARGIEDDGLPLFLKASPLLRLQVDDAACTSLDWMSGTKVGVGLSNGHVAIWDVGEALESGSGSVLPTAYIQVVASPIRSVTAGRMPPGDAQGLPQHAVDAPYLIAGSYDGNAIIADTRDITNVLEMNHQRTPIVSTGFCSQLAAGMYGDGDYNVVLHKLYGQATNRSSILVMHRGPVWSITTSDYHTMAATGSADGSVLVANFNAGWHKRKGAPIMYHRRFEIDHDTESGEYRMLDRFQVEYVTATDALDRGIKHKKAAGGANPALMKSVGWAPQCAIHKVAWNSANGLESAGWLASGMASGLVRVEWVAGRFQGGKAPDRMTNPAG